VKQAILLAGLRAQGPTVVEEKIASADHLERAMTRARMPIDVQGTIATLHPPRDEDAVAPQMYDGIGSQALVAPMAAAALVVPGSNLTLREAGMNPTRSDLIALARLMGANTGVSPRGDRQGEPFGDLSFKSAELVALDLGGETMVRLGDGAVSLFALAAKATGSSLFADLVAGARGADAKIWGRAAGFLRSAGVEALNADGGIRVVGNGGAPFKPLQVTTGGDPRLALLGTVLALGAKGTSMIDDVDCLAGEFPRWVGSLRALGAQLEVRSS
jgi:3-phosphoshikimate 1-carboxyvinyltransferase